VKGQPTHRENRVVARCGGSRGLRHDLFQANVELGLAFVSLAHNWSFALARLKISIRTRSAKGVVGQASGHEQEAGEENRRQCHSVDHPVTDAGDDLKKRAFPGGAGSSNLRPPPCKGGALTS
jgi:hypothetical protein